MCRPVHPDYVPSSYDPLPGADSPEIPALPLQSSSSSSKPPPPKVGNAAWISTASLFDFSDDVLDSLSIAAAGGSDAAHSSASAASAAHQHVLPRLSPAAASSSSASSSSFASFAIPAAPSANRSARPAPVAMGAFDAEAGASQSVLFAAPTQSQRGKQMQQLQQQRQQIPLQNAPAARPGANAHISTFDSYVQNESQMCASAAVLPSLHVSQWASSSSSASAYDSAASFAASELRPQVSHEDRYRTAMLAVIRRNEALSADELALNSFESAQQRAARLAPNVLAPPSPPAAHPENQQPEPHSLASFEVPVASRKRGAEQINRAVDDIASSSSSSSSSVSSIPPLERGSNSSSINVSAVADSIPAPAPLAAPAVIRESDEEAQTAERLRLLEVELEQKRAAAKKKKAKSFV
jgi:hypothetical protein